MAFNFFKGFRLFSEQEDQKQEKDSPKTQPDNYISTIKKQVKVPKTVWFGMPVTISHTKIGDQMIREPKVFYVTDFDSEVVTIKNVALPGAEDEDMDGEINMDNDDFENSQSFTIPRSDFYKLLEPPNFQGADYAGASSAVQWRNG